MPNHPLAEVFGFPIDNKSPEANRYRKYRLCPFNNKVPNCTKDKANDPLGVCSVYEGEKTTITCPVRFRENWIIAEHAAAFFFPRHTAWTSLTEVRLNDKHGRSAGNIDVVLVAYDDQEQIVDFGALHIQAALISEQTSELLKGNVAPQIFFKGAIFKAWKKKQAIALQRSLYDTLPIMPSAEPRNADIAWLTYDFRYDTEQHKYVIKHHETTYSRFESVFDSLAPANIQRPEASSEQQFVDYLYAQTEDAVVA